MVSLETWKFGGLLVHNLFLIYSPDGINVYALRSSSLSSSYKICNAPYVAVKMLFVGAGRQLRHHKRN